MLARRCRPPIAERVHPTSAGLSRFPVAEPRVATPRPAASVLVLSGRGGGHALGRAGRGRRGTRRRTGTWTVLGRELGELDASDPYRASWLDADVVVVQAGENAVADVAASRDAGGGRPAPRPFAREQAGHGPRPCSAVAGRAVVAAACPAERLGRACSTRRRGLDGEGWASWCDGEAADRFAAFSAPSTRGRRWSIA